MSAGQLVTVAIAAVLVFWMVGAYNRLVALRNGIVTAWAQVDEALQRRGDAVAPMVAALRAPLADEQGALDALAAAQLRVAAAADALRERPVMAAHAGALASAESALAPAASRVLALVEQQPALLADVTLATALGDWRAAEPRLAFARQLFNDAVAAYNAAARQFPTRLLTRLYGFGTAGRL
jgi:LemA protein